MEKYTPGPWHVDIVIGGEHIPSIFAGRVKVASLNPYLVGQNEVGDRMANARLIAAAPELLEALRGLLTPCRCDPTPGTACAHVLAAEAAIARATGEV